MSINRKRDKTWKNNIPICNFCDAVGRHYSWQCFMKPKKPMAKEAPVSKAKRVKTSNEWYDNNPPDENGEWECYLKISPNCLTKVDRSTINLEHVIPRCKRPDLKYKVDNLRPSCQPCNKLKGPWTLEELAETYPQARKLLDEGY